MIGLTVVCGCSVPVVGSVLEVDQIDEGRALVIDRVTGISREVERDRLPVGAVEGDVVVDGRTDPALAAEMRAEVQRARARLPPSGLRSGGALGDAAGEGDGR